MTELDPNAAYLRLDLTRLGDAIVRLALTSRQLGHASAVHTVRDYWHPGGSLEHEFLRDVVLGDPDEVAETWFGGTDNAVALTNAIRNHHADARAVETEATTPTTR